MYLGVDLGTSSIKLLLADENGKLIASKSEEYPIEYPKEGWSQQNPEDWWNGFKSAIIELGKNYNLKEIEAISFSGQMHGLVILDENDNVIRPAILWNDGRTIKECEYLNNVIGKDKLIEWTGNIALTGFTAPKLLWLKENEPKISKKYIK
jgi:Sugar (pentulose and hexulose) kinases